MQALSVIGMQETRKSPPVTSLSQMTTTSLLQGKVQSSCKWPRLVAGRTHCVLFVPTCALVWQVRRSACTIEWSASQSARCY